MEIIVIIALVVVVAGVLLLRKRSRGKDDTSLSTGNPSANEGDDRI
ncbi:hypothetical protein [Nocardia brasiliensis]|nr:hypothetical protein [Nocardia brasiliensis]